jgi:hypothetical protein
MESYPCYQDEETKLAFADHTVNYADQPPNSWFIVFRQVVNDGVLAESVQICTFKSKNMVSSKNISL